MQMTEQQERDNDEIVKLMPDLCNVLRIARMELHIRENIIKLRMGPQNKSLNVPHCTHILFDSPKYSMNTQVTEEFKNSGGGACLYIAFPYENAEPWTDTELSRIRLLMRLVFTFNARNSLLQTINRLAYYDQELNVHNLTFFFRYLSIQDEKKQLVGQTAINFNLKRFSAVNEQLGRPVGTFVLRQFTAQINAILGDEGVVSRLGGDNFVLIVSKNKTQSIIDALSGIDIVYDSQTGDKVLISAYIGAYKILPYVSNEFISEVMDRITIAGHIARESSETDIVWFDENMLKMKSRQMKILNLFPQALENNDIIIQYQPKIALTNYDIAGAEALCRWVYNGRVIPPAEFIPVLENGMDICRLDFYVLDQVCANIRRWLDTGKRVVRISVNLSRRHMADMDLLKHITEIVDRYHVPHKYIEIELTETTTDVEFRDLKRIVSGLQRSGFATSVDDFGVGYSSLTLIKDIPWDVLKVDKSFLPAPNEKGSLQKRVMFKYVLAMAQEMGIECVAEGVETKEQLDLLCENSCDLAQGFFFDHPLTLEEFEMRLDHSEYPSFITDENPL